MLSERVIALDAMGGDNAPLQIIQGGVNAAEKFDVKILLVGNESIIKEHLKDMSYNKDKIEVIHADEVITAHDSPTEAIKNKKNSSMMVGLKLVKEQKAKAFVSAGNTGALLAGATVSVGRIKGIDRPAIATLFPNERNFTFLIDSGANAEVKPHYLAQFALMGFIYMQSIMGIDNPKVGLLNIGSEEEKGNTISKEAFKILRESDLNFIGNVEGNGFAKGDADVVVCDGFTGNIVLKFAEELSMSLFRVIKKEITASFISKLAASILSPSFKRIKKRMDSSEYGGAPLLGLNGLVVKAHGSSNDFAIENAIKQCVNFIDSDIVDKIAKKIQESNFSN